MNMICTDALKEWAMEMKEHYSQQFEKAEFPQTFLFMGRRNAYNDMLKMIDTLSIEVDLDENH